MTRKKAIDFLKNKPVKFARLLGFNKLTELHNEWIKEMIKSDSDRTIQASRGTYKTTCVTIAIALVVILLPLKRICFMRKTEDDVKEVITQVKKILEHPVTQIFVKSIYGEPLKLTVSNATELSTSLNTDIKGTSQLIGIGIGGSLTGKHFDYIFTDDIVNIKDRISRAERENTKLVYQELQNIKNRNGRIFNTGTPWHKDDCFEIMPEAEKYNIYHEKIKNILISDEEISELKKSMTASLFAANYELKHIADDDVIFTNPVVNADIEKIMNGTSHCDAAFYGEDYTAFTIVTIHNGKFYVFGKVWRKHIDDVMAEIVNLHNKYLCDKMYVENNADKGFVAKEFRNNGLRVVSYSESQNKYTKITTYLKFEWENIVFVEGTDDEYIDMICDYNDNAEHDDAPDSLASLIRVLSKNRNNSTSPKTSIFY